MTTYIVAQSRPSGPVHLSDDGEYTLCQWRIRDSWLVSIVPVPLSALGYYGVHQCRECRRAAEWLERERRRSCANIMAAWRGLEQATVPPKELQ